jgi:hypothetical protein
LDHALDRVRTAVGVYRALRRCRLRVAVGDLGDRHVGHADGFGSLSPSKDSEAARSGDGEERALAIGENLRELGGMEGRAVVGERGRTVGLGVSTRPVAVDVCVSSHASSQSMTLTWRCDTTTIVAVGDVVLESGTTTLLRTRSVTVILSPRAAALIVINRHTIYEATAWGSWVARARAASTTGRRRTTGVDAGTGMSVAAITAEARGLRGCVVLGAWSHLIAEEL